jgi:hypothetical protein
MLVALEYRDRLTTYCLVRKVTQEVAVNEMIGEALERLDGDPVVKAKLDRARELKAALDAL